MINFQNLILTTHQKKTKQKKKNTHTQLFNPMHVSQIPYQISLNLKPEKWIWYACLNQTAITFDLHFQSLHYLDYFVAELIRIKMVPRVLPWH